MMSANSIPTYIKIGVAVWAWKGKKHTSSQTFAYIIVVWLIFFSNSLILKPVCLYYSISCCLLGK